MNDAYITALSNALKDQNIPAFADGAMQILAQKIEEAKEEMKADTYQSMGFDIVEESLEEEEEKCPKCGKSAEECECDCDEEECKCEECDCSDKEDCEDCEEKDEKSDKKEDEEKSDEDEKEDEDDEE